ncbi:hypothetical protein E8E11_003627 [Didymella keratinophila]|nr:hypothetical protein E8E11_003627 [Didymella keratinophila]
MDFLRKGTDLSIPTGSVRQQQSHAQYHWFGTPDPDDWEHPIGYLLSKTIIDLQEPWVRAKIDEKIGTPLREQRAMVKTLGKKNDEYFRLATKWGQEAVEAKKEAFEAKTETKEVLENAVVARKQAIEAREQAIKDLMMMREQREKINTLEAEVQRLRKQNEASSNSTMDENRTTRH